MALWYWKTARQQATIDRIWTLQGERYRWTIYDLWHGRYGNLVSGPMSDTGIADSLSEAKKQVFEYLAK